MGLKNGTNYLANEISFLTYTKNSSLQKYRETVTFKNIRPIKHILLYVELITRLIKLNQKKSVLLFKGSRLYGKIYAHYIYT
jgi:hypothetical protein